MLTPDSLGLRRHVAAFPRRDMSRRSKAQSCLCTPKFWLLAFKLKLTSHPGPQRDAGPNWRGEGVKLQLVVTTALILTFSPKRRDSDSMRLFTRLCGGRIQSRVLGGSGVQGASLLGGNLRTRGSREQRKPFLPRLGERAGVRAGFKLKLNCLSEFSDRLSDAKITKRTQFKNRTTRHPRQPQQTI
jgi:hypothetical protein